MLRKMMMRLKKMTLMLCLFGGSATVFAQPVLVKSTHEIEEYRLDNGLRVILAPNNKETKVFMNTVYLTGSLNDPKGKSGLAHLLEHLAFKGTKDVANKEFQRQLDQYTLMTNASTDYYSTKYTNIIRPDQNALNHVIYLEAQRMDKLVLQKKYVPSEIEIVRREREIRLDQPFAVVMDQMWKSAYGNQSLGRLPIGDLAELKSIQLDELQKFYRTWYAPNNAVMVISGKFDKAQVLKTVEQNFNTISARTVPQMPSVPTLDSSKLPKRDFVVKKGSQYALFHLYLNGHNPKIQPALAFAPYLYTLQPSGHLYQSMVETGTATDVQASIWLDRDFNLVFMGAAYTPPAQQTKVVDQALKQGVEQNKPFNEVELKRVKNLIGNDVQSLLNSSVEVGKVLSDYVVAENGQWDKFFTDQQAVQNMPLAEVNQTLTQFLVAPHRISAEIQPTPDSEKKAQKQKTADENNNLGKANTETAEPVKDIKTYQQESQSYVESSAKKLKTIEQSIQRGSLHQDLTYALFPTQTLDNKVYATFTVHFGTAQSLWNKGQLLDLTSYLLLRGSKQHSLQDIADQSIAANGQAVAMTNENGITIQIQANKAHFNDYLKFVLDVMKQPSFEQSQFDLAKSQSLANLDRSYTEPATVSALTMARLLEVYQPGDLRYHFEPMVVKKQFQQATQAQVKALFDQFFGFNDAELAVTGDFDSKQMRSVLQQNFANWKTAQPYQRLTTTFRTYPAQKIHALAEQRQFGNYQGLLTLPVGVEDLDAPALIVLSYILGNSQLSSRLGQELREKRHLVYGFGSDLELDDQDSVGTLSIEANYTPEKADQVSVGIHKVFTDLLRNGVTDLEVEAAKANILKKRVTSLDDHRIVHQMLNTQLERGKDMSDREKRDQAIIKLTKSDIDAVIKKYIQPEHYVEVMADQYGKPAPSFNMQQ